MDVVAAVAQQNVQVAAGQIGQQPVPKGQQYQLTINTQGRLIEPEQFADIILKAGPDAGQGQTLSAGAGQTSPGTSTNQGVSATPVTAIVRLRDVARVEQGSRQYDQSCTLDGRPSVALSIYQLPGSNALGTANGVYANIKGPKTPFPD